VVEKENKNREVTAASGFLLERERKGHVCRRLAMDIHKDSQVLMVTKYFPDASRIVFMKRSFSYDSERKLPFDSDS
jgi:hypothetical protein